MTCSQVFVLLALAGCASPAAIVSQPTAAVSSVATTDAPTINPLPATTTPAPATATPPAPTPTDTATPTATSSPPPPTATATLPAPIANTLLLYTTAATDPAGQAFWAFRTLPPLPQLDPAGFDTLYGPTDSLADFSMLFADLSPQLSPDGQTLLVPGLPGYAEQGIAGTGTWLVDRATGATRQLLPRGVSATWSPGSDAITYVEGTTLYTLSTATGATPQPLFDEPNLWNLYAKWSPDGQWIAAVSGIQHWPTEETEPTLTFTYWLVPAGGGPARELAQLGTQVGGYSAGAVSWSPDGQYLLAHNHVYDLAGNQLLPEGIGGLAWLPDRPQLLHLSAEPMSIITVTGEEVALVGQSAVHSTLNWAFSGDGRRLAFSQLPTNDGMPLAIYDLESGETQIVGVIPDARYVYPLRWSADDALLIAGANHGEARYDIWTLPVAANSTAERLITDAVLIDAVP